MHECDATADVGRDGQLFCEREPGHEGMHRGAVWWFPLAELDYIDVPGWGYGSTDLGSVDNDSESASLSTPEGD